MISQRRKFRILYAGPLPEQHRGGAAISNAQILIGLAALGHRISAFAPIDAESSAFSDSFAEQNPGIEITRFSMPSMEVDPYNPAPQAYRDRQTTQVKKLLGSRLRLEPADLIFVGRESFLWGVPDLAERHGVPCVLNTRGILNSIANGSYPQEVGRALVREMRRTTSAIVPAQHMLEKLQCLGITQGVVIRNSIDTMAFSPGPRSPELVRRLGLAEDQTVIMHISNLKAVKRVRDVIESAERVLHEDERLVYVMVGDGPLRAELEQGCAARNLADRIRFVGWVPNERMPDYVRLADIVVMPSEAEGLARAYLETQACGRLLLASDIAPAREISNRGDTAILFRKGDINDLTAKTMLAVRDASLRATIGRRAREFVVRRHGLAEAVASYEAILQKLVCIQPP